MLGHKSRESKWQVAVSLEALVPADNFCHQVDPWIDLSFVRDRAAEFYSGLERPSIDPVVFIIGYWKFGGSVSHTRFQGLTTAFPSS